MDDFQVMTENKTYMEPLISALYSTTDIVGDRRFTVQVEFLSRVLIFRRYKLVPECIQK